MAKDEHSAALANVVGMKTKGKTAPGTVDPVNDGAGVVVALGKRKPLVAVTADVTTGPDCVGTAEVPVDPPTIIAPVLDPTAVPSPVPPIVPVHNARTGQHATFPAESRAQTWFVGQQAPLFPSAPQFVNPPGHACRLNNLGKKSV